MCLLAILFRVVDDAPLVVGANREEAYHRPSEPPQVLDGPCRSVAGLDVQAGGTWLGVNQHGLLVAVTNRHKQRPVPQPRSRGLLARELLECRTTKEAVDLAAQELDLHRYLGCNLILADGDRLVVFQAGDWLRVKMLPPGLHVLTNHDINDGTDPRLAYALGRLTEREFESGLEAMAALRQLCAHTGGDGTPPICLHGKSSGTVSSSLVVLRQPLAHSLYLHAHGPPDRTPYQDYSHLLREITPDYLR